MRSSIKGVVPEWYTLSIDKDEDEPVRFYLQPLNGMDQAKVLMGSYDPDNGTIGGPGIIKAFKLGVKDWENIEDSTSPGNQLAFSRDAMNSIPPGWIMEVGNQVLDISKINQEQGKN